MSHENPTPFNMEMLQQFIKNGDGNPKALNAKMMQQFGVGFMEKMVSMAEKRVLESPALQQKIQEIVTQTIQTTNPEGTKATE